MRKLLPVYYYRIIFAGLIVLSMLLTACASQKPKVYNVGIMYGLESQLPIAENFKSKMTELGYVEGENIIYDSQFSADSAELQSIAEEFVNDEVDLILAFPDSAAVAAKTATAGTDVPVVFASAFSELNDLVESVREPGGNMTGVRIPGPEITIKTQEYLLDLMPDIQQIWVAYDPDYAPSQIVMDAWRPAASSSGVTLVEVHVKSPADIEADLQAREEDTDIDAMMLVPDIVTRNPEAFQTILEFANAHNIPVAGGSSRLVEKGMLLSVSTDQAEQGRLAATIADQILKGAAAGTVPVNTPDTLLVFNYKVAQDLGLTVPDEILTMANEIIR